MILKLEQNETVSKTVKSECLLYEMARLGLTPIYLTFDYGQGNFEMWPINISDISL